MTNSHIHVVRTTKKKITRIEVKNTKRTAIGTEEKNATRKKITKVEVKVRTDSAAITSKKKRTKKRSKQEAMMRGPSGLMKETHSRVCQFGQPFVYRKSFVALFSCSCRRKVITCVNLQCAIWSISGGRRNFIRCRQIKHSQTCDLLGLEWVRI